MARDAGGARSGAWVGRRSGGSARGDDGGRVGADRVSGGASVGGEAGMTGRRREPGEEPEFRARADARLRRAAAAGAGAALLVATTYAAISWFVYDELWTAPGRCPDGVAANVPEHWHVGPGLDVRLEEGNQLPRPDEVRIPSRDPALPGASLAAWWIPAADPTAAPAFVVVHGTGSCRRDPTVLLAGAIAHRAGASVLLLDLRDHGDSGGDDRRYASGSEEHLDLLGAWDWLRAQGVAAARIVLAGFSSGATVALVAAGLEPRVAAVWADSPQPATVEVLGRVVEAWSGIPGVVVPGAVVWARVRAGDDLLRHDVAAAVAALGGRRVAFVAGGADPLVPTATVTGLAAAARRAGADATGPWIVPDAAHAEAILVDAGGYEARLRAFLDGPRAGPATTGGAIP